MKQNRIKIHYAVHFVILARFHTFYLLPAILSSRGRVYRTFLPRQRWYRIIRRVHYPVVFVIIINDARNGYKLVPNRRGDKVTFNNDPYQEAGRAPLLILFHRKKGRSGTLSRIEFFVRYRYESGYLIMSLLPPKKQ